MTSGNLISHACETRKFLMAILHWKQGLLCDKNMLVRNLLLLYTDSERKYIFRSSEYETYLLWCRGLYQANEITHKRIFFIRVNERKERNRNCSVVIRILLNHETVIRINPLPGHHASFSSQHLAAFYNIIR